MKSTRSRVSVNPGEFRQQVGCMMIIQDVADWKVLWDDDEHDFGGKFPFPGPPSWTRGGSYLLLLRGVGCESGDPNCAICETSKKGFRLFRTPRLKMAGRNSVRRPFPCKFPCKVALLTCWCPFRLRRLAQSLRRGFGLRHFSCKFPYKVALVQCPSAVRLRRLAQSVARGSGKGRLHTEELLHTEAFTRKSLYTEELFHRRAFTHRRAFAHRRAIYTEELLHIRASTQRSFYTQELLHREAFRQKNRYTEKLLHRRAFTHRNFYAEELQKSFYTQIYTQELLHRRTFTQRIF